MFVLDEDTHNVFLNLSLDNFSLTASKPLLMLRPWSPSPIVASSSVKYNLFSLITSAILFIIFIISIK